MSNPLWGVYAGFELFEHVPRPGAEEYIDSEKYEYRPRDWAGAEAAGQSLAPYLTRLNEIRAEHPALRDLQNLTLHSALHSDVLVFSKRRAASLFSFCAGWLGPDPDDGGIILITCDLIQVSRHVIWTC